ncbi:unnamed protein product [Trichogramma brassicae]|uniref:Coiled-coil domain-containing protein 137 n=1 Tax=Trichogramma brassicae TaxID=86971 RepID=A0A6H5IBN7_9HYME|nr:unnamed protein product [Trichogramma brassicae]
MGRKIPGKKHRGVKDPEKQQAKRLAAVESVINAPPKNIDHQDVPKSLERVIQLKNAVKDGSIGKKQKKKKTKGAKKLIQLGAEQINYKLPAPTARPEKVVPVFNQQPGENKFKFWNRVNQETEAFIKETEFELKYNVEVKRNAATGEVEGFRKKAKEELDQIAIEKLQEKHSNIKRKKKKTKTEKLKLLEKKNKKLEDNADDFQKYEDKVEFGEVAMAPPKLSLPRKAIKTDNKGKNLLLNKIFEEKSSSKKENVQIDKSGKRKNLPIGERRNLEREQSNAIEAYRRLKAQKSANA